MNPREIDTTRRPFVLVWEVIQACELACRHCRADAKPRRHPSELTTPEGRRLPEEARRFGEGQLVVLSGGDPLARDDTVDLVDHGTDIGLRMTLTPSETASLTPDRVSALADAGLRRMALSIDGGSAAAHDAFRGEQGSLEATLRAAEAARTAGLPLGINTTVCVETVGELPAMRDLVEGLGAVLWSVFFLVPVGRGRVLDPVSPERAERVMEWLAGVSDDAPFGVKTTEAPHYRRIAIQRGGGPDGPGRPSPDGIGRRTGITAGDGFAFVSHVGEVYPSGFSPSRPATSGRGASSRSTASRRCSSRSGTPTGTSRSVGVDGGIGRARVCDLLLPEVALRVRGEEASSTASARSREPPRQRSRYRQRAHRPVSPSGRSRSRRSSGFDSSSQMAPNGRSRTLPRA